MRPAHLCIILSTFCFYAQAQYTPFFTEDFSSNTHNWPTSEKKGYMQLSSDQYHIYNDEGKQQVVTLIDIPFKSDMNYKIETRVEQSYTPAPDGGAFGVFFGASDEKNGFAFVLDKYSGFILLKSVNGKWLTLKEDRCLRLDTDTYFYKGDKVTLLLENHRWKFFVNDSLAYSCLPSPWKGNKIGFCVSPQSGMIVEEFNIQEADQLPGYCPISFTQDEFNTELNKIICAAPEDFSSFLGEFDFAYGEYESWNTQNVALEGARKTYIASGGSAQEYRKGRDFIFTFVCSDSMSLEVNQAYFMDLQNAIAKLSPSCCTLEQADVNEYLSDALFASVISRGKIKHPSLGNVAIEVELDLVNVGSTFYSLLLHVNVPKT